MRSSLICTRLPRSTFSRLSTSEDTEVENETRVFSESVAVHNMQVPVGPQEHPLGPNSFPVDEMMLRLLIGMVGQWDKMRGGGFRRSANFAFPHRPASRALDASLIAARGKLRVADGGLD